MMVKDEISLDAFANDFLAYLCNEFYITNCWCIKVIECTDANWAATVPESIRKRLEVNYQNSSHPVVIVYDLDFKVSEENHRICLRIIGFSPDQTDAFSQFDMLIIFNRDRPIPPNEAPPFLSQFVVISHVALHYIERILQRQIIVEQEYTHNYDDHQARGLLHRFVEELTVEEFTRRYCLE
jgi:hypothetical protein